MINLSILEEIKDLRTVWPHEALDFTPWLSQDDNINLLADAVGLDITVDETESQFSKAFKRRKPSTDHWMNFSVGSSACHIAVSQIQKRNELDVELYIPEDKELFQSLLQNKDAIENESGLQYDWRELPERKASRIVITKSVDFGDKGQWGAQFAWIEETMLKMKKAFKKHL